MAISPLRDRRILIVEDEYLVAMSLGAALESVGSIVIGPTASIEKALRAIEMEPAIDAAVVDVNLGGAMAYPVANALLAKAIPFVFASGYEENVLRGRYAGIRICLKPYHFAQIEEALAGVMAERESRK